MISLLMTRCCWRTLRTLFMLSTTLSSTTFLLAYSFSREHQKSEIPKTQYLSRRPVEILAKYILTFEADTWYSDFLRSRHSRFGVPNRPNRCASDMLCYLQCSLDSCISARGSRHEQPLELLCGSLRTIMLSPHLLQHIDRR